MNLIPHFNGWICPDDPGTVEDGKPRWSVNAIEARIVAELCKGLNVLEIGTGLGVSTRAIAEKAKKVFTVDIDPWVADTVANTLPLNVCFFSDISFVPTELDACFIDGCHSFDQCTQDLKDARKHLKKDGLFIFHDAKMQGVADVIKGSGLVIVPIETYAGMVLAWRK